MTQKEDVLISIPTNTRIHEDQGPSRARRLWKFITFVLTWWIPTLLLKLCGLRRKDIRDAWREKVAIFMIILFACFAVAFFIIWLPRILCPRENIMTLFEIQSKNKLDDAYVAAYGRYFEITEFVNDHINKLGVNEFQMQSVLGQDVSQMFFPARNWDKACPGITNPGASWDNLIQRNDNKFWPHMVVNSDTNTIKDYLGYLARYARGRVGWPLDFLKGITDTTKKLIVMYGNVYDVAAYFQAQSEPGFFDDNMYKIFTNVRTGQDATPYMEQLRRQNPVYYRNVLNCMNNLFYIGVVDTRNSLRCKLSNVILVAASGVIVGVIGFKFLSAFVNFGKGSNPQQINKYVLVQVPCYTEGKESLETTLNSIAVTRYDDNYKLAIIVCDGLVTGKENSKPTPDMVLEILYGSEEAADEAKRRAHPPMTYFSVADGSRALNKGQIYSGIYEIEAHKLPFIVVIKTGNDTEKQKGNRGKRDSQILLMRFLNNIYARAPLTELEYALYREMKIVMGMAPEQFEYMLMVDADTSITRDSLIKMVHYMSQDTNTIGLCGETFVANEKESWTTMIQVYEYFISHHLAKAFESMFGAVTCLPGCFCMYRIRTDNNLPLLIAPMLIEDYADPKDNTLHKKNLLRLGEDRYLTTLVLKYFRKYKTRYTSDAQCYTNAPDTWSILVSQRRRWINSTVHNLMELILNIRDLCGFCCFSMRFVVLIDLLSTLVAPSAVVYVGYLIYTMIFERNEAFMISLIMIGAIYGLQLVIILLKRKWEHIMWMVIYVLAMPLFNFYLPLYSFWHMDDFNWGNTTVAIDDHGKEKELEVDEAFDPSCIERKKISQWEAEWKEDDDDLSAPASERTMSTAVRFPAASIHPMMPMASLHPMIPPPQTMMPPQPMPSSMMPNAAFSTYASSQVHTTMPMQQISVPYANYVPSHVASYVNSYRPAPPAFSHYATSEMLPRVPISRAGSYLSSECYPQESASNVGTTRKSRQPRQPRQHKKKHGKKSRSDGSNEKYERDDGKGDGKDGRDGMKDGKDDGKDGKDGMKNGKDGKDGLKTGINLTLPEIPSMGTLF